MTDRHCRNHETYVDGCEPCKWATLTVSTAAMPSRHNGVGPTANPSSNAWERGVPVDDKGLPYLDEQLKPVGSKEFSSRVNRGDWDYDGRRASTAPPVQSVRGG